VSSLSPNAKFSYELTRKLRLASSTTGALVELNFRIGVGVTGSTDHLIAKMILGYPFNF
jgi:hypothetical protein